MPPSRRRCAVIGSQSILTGWSFLGAGALGMFVEGQFLLPPAKNGQHISRGFNDLLTA
jgi:hypothetical protein